MLSFEICNVGCTQLTSLHFVQWNPRPPVKSSRVNWGERQIGAESCFCLLSFAQKLRDEEMSSLLQPNNISSYFNITALQSVKDIQVQEYKNTMLKDFCHQPQISSKEALVIEIQSVGLQLFARRMCSWKRSFLSSIFSPFF